MKWILENYQWIVAILIQGFVAYSVLFLSKKLSDKARLEHKEQIKKKADSLEFGKEVYLVNINRYFKNYPSNEEKILGGYSHIKAEIKSTKFDAIEFFASMPEQVYQKSNGRLSFKGRNKEKAFLGFPVGIVPYEWIKYIDLKGDEYGFVPLFYCHFSGRTYWKKFWKRLLTFGYPYKKIVYYKNNPIYKKSTDPSWLKYELIECPISRK